MRGLMIGMLGLVALLLVLVFGSGTWAAPGDLIGAIPCPVGEPSDGFGLSVGAYDNRIIVGAPNYTANPPHDGAAYVYDRSNLQTPLYNLPHVSVPTFGTSVAAVGNNILVGATSSYTNLYSGSGSLLQTFPSPNPSDDFGWSVAGVGNDILIAAPSTTWGGYSHAGLVYLYDGATPYPLKTTFQSPTPSSNKDFGRFVTAVGNNVLIGSQLEQAAYLFDTNGNLLHKFTEAVSYFGRSGAARGNDILVSAFSRTYLYDGNTYALKNVFPVGGVAATVGNDILIRDPGGSNTHLYDGTNYQEIILPAMPMPGYNWSYVRDLAASGNDIVIGSATDGKVYLHQGVVPEPSTFVLLGVAAMSLLATGAWRRRKRAG